MIKITNPAGLPRPVGFSHVAIAGPGQLVTVAGQTGHRPDGTLGGSLLEQFRSACENVAAALAAVGATPENVVSLQIFATDLGAYREALAPIGEAYRATFGSHYPPMALIGVTELFDPLAKVELLAIAFLESSRNQRS